MSRKRSNHCHPTATAPYTALDFLTHIMPNSTVTVPDFPAQKVPDSISLTLICPQAAPEKMTLMLSFSEHPQGYPLL